MSAENLCVRCGRPTPDGYACTDETRKAAEQLRQIVDMLPAARDVAHGLSRRGGSGSTTGKPGSQIPIDLTAMAKLDAVQNELTTWARRIGSLRGFTPPWFTDDGDAIADIAHWLAPHLEWIRHQPDREPDQDGNTWGADQFLTDVDAYARIVSSIARGPAPQKYLGPCGAVLAQTAEPCPGDCSCRSGPRTALSDACAACSCFETCHPIVPTDAEGQICDGDIYGRPDGTKGRCRTCGAEVGQADRRAWLDSEVRAHAFRAAEIANAYGINVNTIRTWAHDRPALHDHAGNITRAARPAKLHPHAHDRDGRPLFLVGDVLDLAAGDAARREEARAERARRAAARQGAEMGA